jgi:hypothetical protein
MERTSRARPRIVFGTRALVLAWSLAAVAFACSGGVESTSIADGQDASTNPVGSDSSPSPSDVDGSDVPDVSADTPDTSPSPSDAGLDADGDGRAPSGGPAGPGLVACGPDTCTAITELCTRVLAPVVPPDLPDGTVLLDATAPCQPYPTNSVVSVRCDDPSDCPSSQDCIVTGKGFTIIAPSWHDAGISSLASMCKADAGDSVTFETDAEAASFSLRTCGDAAPCPSGQTCHLQTCLGFAFDLCGDIPDGACAR